MTDAELISNISERLELLQSMLPEVNEHLQAAKRFSDLLRASQNAQSGCAATKIVANKGMEPVS